LFGCVGGGFPISASDAANEIPLLDSNEVSYFFTDVESLAELLAEALIARLKYLHESAAALILNHLPPIFN
jgi:hypothetical protein